MKAKVKQGQLRVWTNPKWVDCGSSFLIVGPAPVDLMSRPAWYIHSADEGIGTLPESEILEDSKLLR